MRDPTPTDRPTAVLDRRGAKRARAGHPWIFRGDVRVPPQAEGGAVVRVVDPQRNFIGCAFWAARSPIALRLLTRGDEACDRGFFAARLERALQWRARLWPGVEALRLVHAEADLWPGLFVDRYADALVLQAVSEGADAHLDLAAGLLEEALRPRLMVVQNDTSARDFEGLARHRGVLRGAGPTAVRYREGDVDLEVDLLEDLKTGAFLDQRENHAAAAAYLPPGGEALDAFSYHGGFALALAGQARRVVAVEVDAGAATRLRANVARNRRPVEVVEGNSFDVLRALEREAASFDVVVLDPPALAKRQGDVAAALRAYKELNLRALRLCAPGGVLVTCSCSGKLTPDLFADVIEAAARDARKVVQVLERRGASRDHPVLLGVPETEYLKCWILRVYQR